MADLEDRGSGSYFAHRMQSDARDIAASPSSQTQLNTKTYSLDRAPKSGNDLTALTDLRASRRPKVSVMVITYNHAKYIAQALESVLMQETNFDFEINVIEDCSTDGTQEVVMRYVRKYPHIVKPFFNQKNIGFKVTQKNFYRGFKTLTGEYLAILEGDDYWTSPHKLQKQVDFLDANPAFAICAHNTIKVYEDGSVAPHRFLYWGPLGDSTVEDVICLRTFFHTTGVLYRNVFKGVPPRHYRSKWSCDIFIMISHAVFGKVHHIDEDMAVYRAHAGGRFSGMKALDGWLFNIDGLRRYNAWLGYRYLRTFSESISAYCEHVLRSHGKEGVAPLSSYQLMKVRMIWACYQSIFRVLNLSSLRQTGLSELPPLPGSAHWDLVWGLNVKAIEGQRVVPDHPVLKLTAVYTDDPAVQHRHALSECLSGLTPGGIYRVSLWVKPIDDINVQLHLRDSVRAETGVPANEGEARYNFTTSSVMTVNGLLSPGTKPDLDGWQKVWANLTTEDGKIFVYLGLVRKSDNRHVFRGRGEELLFGGIEISHPPSV
jgi:glycosyltransferase involved in cell wall biosynthesis